MTSWRETPPLGGRTRPAWRIPSSWAVTLATTNQGPRVVFVERMTSWTCACGRPLDTMPTYSHWVVCGHCGATRFVDAGFTVD
jgi:hypothetical protein